MMNFSETRPSPFAISGNRLTKTMFFKELEDFVQQGKWYALPGTRLGVPKPSLRDAKPRLGDPTPGLGPSLENQKT